jgi:hypothetical protein
MSQTPSVMIERIKWRMWFGRCPFASVAVNSVCDSTRQPPLICSATTRASASWRAASLAAWDCAAAPAAAISCAGSAPGASGRAALVCASGACSGSRAGPIGGLSAPKMALAATRRSGSKCLASPYGC